MQYASDVLEGLLNASASEIVACSLEFMIAC